MSTEPTEEHKRAFKTKTGRDWDSYGDDKPVERKPLAPRDQWLMVALDAVTTVQALGKKATNPSLDFLCGIGGYVHAAVVRVVQSLADHVEQELAARDERIDAHDERLDKIEMYLRRRHDTLDARIDARINERRDDHIH